MEKTNVMRMLEGAGVAYLAHEYDPALTDGQAVAAAVGKEEEQTFKTLVTIGASGRHHVFMIPVNASLHLKKAAKAAGEKSVAMLPQKELLPLTGYVHGGCSPMGMKKQFPVYVDETAVLFDTICFSAGRRGAQVEVDPQALCRLVGGQYADLTE